MINTAVSEIFNNMGFQDTSLRRLVAGVFSLISSVTLMTAAAVGLGRAASISNILKPIYPAVLTAALAYYLGCLLLAGIDKTFENFGFPNDDIVRVLGGASFSLIGSVSLTAAASAGFGLYQSIPAVLFGIANSFFIPIQLVYSLGFMSLVPAGRTLLIGPPTWDQILQWYDPTVYLP